MANAERDVLIAGGGIGGLASAIALARKGLGSVVLERSSFTEESGAGIQLGPNATRILRALGNLEEVERAAFGPEAVWLFDGITGRRLGTMPLGMEAERRFGAPYLTLHRADLHGALLSVCKSLAEVGLRPSFEVIAAQAAGDTVAAIAADGRRAEGSSLVGADGLWSTVRQHVAPEAALRFARATASRALMTVSSLRAPFDAPVVGLWLGPRAHLVHYPVRGGSHVNLVAVTAGGAEGQGWSQTGDAEALLRSFGGWCKESRSLLEQADSWRRWSLYRLRPLARWSTGRVVLLGDAAHPVLPYLGQGAALGLEDAITLAEGLARTPKDPANAFRHYESLRRARAARVQRVSQRLGALYHLAGPMRPARNFLLSRKERSLASFDWLYGHRGTSV
ncbi:MAG: FAD-dependent monooxygenase [Methyloceanibacter sp.]